PRSVDAKIQAALYPSDGNTSCSWDEISVEECVMNSLAVIGECDHRLAFLRELDAPRPLGSTHQVYERDPAGTSCTESTPWFSFPPELIRRPGQFLSHFAHRLDRLGLTGDMPRQHLDAPRGRHHPLPALLGGA